MALHRLVTPFAVAMLAAALAGCGATMVAGDDGAEPAVAPAATSAAATPAPAAAPVVGPDAPHWRVGDEWTWSDGYGLKVIRVEGERTRFERTDAKDQWQEREAVFLTGSQSATTLRQLVFRNADPNGLFPLAAGKQVLFEREYLANGVLRRHRTSWIVEGRQRVQVPAGTFDTWVLVRRTRSIITNWAGLERWWYSPEVRHYVRMEYRYGDNQPGARVLMSFRPGGT